MNRLVTSQNYGKFLTRYALKNDSSQHIEQFELHKFLLPEQDLSPDFELPDDNDTDHNKFLKSQDKLAFIPTNIKEKHGHIFALLFSCSLKCTRV